MGKAFKNVVKFDGQNMEHERMNPEQRTLNPKQ